MWAIEKSGESSPRPITTEGCNGNVDWMRRRRTRGTRGGAHKRRTIHAIISDRPRAPPKSSRMIGAAGAGSNLIAINTSSAFQDRDSVLRVDAWTPSDGVLSVYTHSVEGFVLLCIIRLKFHFFLNHFLYPKTTHKGRHKERVMDLMTLLYC